MANLKILSFNTQGLGDYFKRRDVFQYLRQKNYSIYFLQDTHFEKNKEKQVRAEWGYECFFASFNSQSRGVAILMNNIFDFKVKDVISDTHGNYIILNIRTAEEDITLVNIYGPNRDSPEFYSTIQSKIQQFQHPKLIIAGDWNLVLNPYLDYYNYRHINNKKSQERVLELIDELELVDVWREINPEVQRYTWRRPNPPQQSRLDFFLISENIVSYTKEADILVGYRSDHSIVSIELEFIKEKRRNTFWKFNSLHLKDKYFVNYINETIRQTKEQYAALVYNTEAIDDIPVEDLQLTISDQLFLDTLIMEIRKTTIAYSSKKKKENNKNEGKLEQEIADLENKIDKTEAETILLQEKKELLQELRKAKLDGILIRSKATYTCCGEKISKYYCNMENRHYVSKQMYKLISDKGERLNSTEEMLTETRKYYQHLYQKKETKCINLKSYVPDLPTLNKNESSLLEGLITWEEATNALKNMKNGKSPGTDGLTVDFFKFFWSKIGGFVIRSLNEGFIKKQMSITQKEGIIICLPKGDKPREYLKNWRPISLLNVTYKIGSSCIANRIKTVLPKLINEDQSGFVAGRYIGDNIRFIYDLIHFLNDKHLPGLLVSIDFEKAFDSISWSYMHTVLKTFGFGESICQWVQAFYENINSSVIVNGTVSAKIQIERGCRQGDPISPYLFILCAELLACKIRTDEEIRGIKLHDTEYKVNQFADDTSFTLEGDQQSFEKLFTTLKEFEFISGLKLNYGKTCNVWLGSKKHSDTKFLPDIDMDWNPPKFKILGIWFTKDGKDMENLNMKEKFGEVKRLYNIWLKRTSTPLGRVAILKSIILSKLVYLWILLPNPPNSVIQQIQKMSIEFVWNQKRDKIKRSVAIHPVEEGGIDIPYIKAFIYSLKLTWFHKYLGGKNQKWVHILRECCEKVPSAHSWGPRALKTQSNPFWKDVFDAYHVLYDRTEIRTADEFLIEPLFLNDKFKINKEVIYFKRWTEKNVYYVKDMYREDGTILNFEEFCTKYNFSARLLDYWGCINCIKAYIRNNKIDFTSRKPNEIPKALDIVTNTKKGSKLFYKIMIGKTKISNPCTNWERILNTNISWSDVFLKTKYISEIKLKWFQIKINNRILVTNSLLKNMGITQTNICNFCDREKDTILHYLWQCEHAQTFWKDFENCLKDMCFNCERLSLNDSLVLFGNDGMTRLDEGFLFILLHAKFFIYKCRIIKIKPTMAYFLRNLHHIKLIDLHVHKIEMKYSKFIKKWLPYNRLFNAQV